MSDDAAVVDAVLAACALTGTTPGDPGSVPEVGLLGGDLHRTLGSPHRGVEALRAGEGIRLPVDLVALEQLDAGGPVHHDDAPAGAALGPTRYFVAHLVASRRPGSIFAGHTVVAMNAAFRGDANLAPRAHPGDGLIDTIEGSLSWPDRIRARRRLVTGTHLPHPALVLRRAAGATFGFDRPVRLVLDGREVARAARFRIRCLPDAVTVVV